MSYYLLKTFRAQINFNAYCIGKKTHKLAAKAAWLAWRHIVWLVFQYTTKLRQWSNNSKFGHLPSGYDDFRDSSKPIKPLEIFSRNNNSGDAKVNLSFCRILLLSTFNINSVSEGSFHFVNIEKTSKQN